MQGHCGVPVLGVSGGEGDSGSLMEGLGSSLLRVSRGLQQDQPDTCLSSRLSALLEIKLCHEVLRSFSDILSIAPL